MLKNNSNGKYVALCGDGYYAIYNASVWKLKLSGSAKNFAWSIGPLEFAIRESAAIDIFRAFKV
jgi:coatomer subunit beta'